MSCWSRWCVVFCIAGVVGLLVPLRMVDAETITLSGSTSPGAYRWLDAANNAYASSFQSTFTYAESSVQILYQDYSTVLAGSVTASNLKPNFTYQIKLSGNSDTADGLRIAQAGRYWQESWNGSAWANGTNLNYNKGDGTYPNLNDQEYLNTKDTTSSTSPTGKLYRYTGYLVMDYFTTDSNGSASFGFIADNSYHVVWKTTQRTPQTDDGPLRTTTIDPSPSQAYDVNYPASIVSVYGEWERLPVNGVFLQPGEYSCSMLLTEESFHGSGGTLGGYWATAMGADFDFTLITVPGDADFNGRVDGADLALWRQHFDPLGLNDNTWSMGDWNHDGLINGEDLALWQQHYNPNWNPESLPEPATLLLVASGLLGLTARARAGRRIRNPVDRPTL